MIICRWDFVSHCGMCSFCLQNCKLSKALETGGGGSCFSPIEVQTTWTVNTNLCTTYIYYTLPKKSRFRIILLKEVHYSEGWIPHITAIWFKHILMKRSKHFSNLWNLKKITMLHSYLIWSCYILIDDLFEKWFHECVRTHFRQIKYTISKKYAMSLALKKRMLMKITVNFIFFLCIIFTFISLFTYWSYGLLFLIYRIRMSLVVFMFAWKFYCIKDAQ